MSLLTRTVTPHDPPPNSTDTQAATSSPNMAAPGLRMMRAVSGPANSQKPPPRAWSPGSAAFSGPVIGSDATFQTMKMTPDATPMTLATTMSTTRQRYCVDDETASLILVTVRALSVSEIGTGLENCLPPCAGIIQIRFDGRSLDQLPLSPAHRTPVFGTHSSHACAGARQGRRRLDRTSGSPRRSRVPLHASPRRYPTAPTGPGRPRRAVQRELR